MDDMEAFETDNFAFQVECDGNPKPVCKWTKEGQSIDTKDGHFSIFENGGVYNLAIKGVTPDDAGEYQAEFTNRAGDKKVSSTLTVHCKLKRNVQKSNYIFLLRLRNLTTICSFSVGGTPHSKMYVGIEGQESSESWQNLFPN